MAPVIRAARAPAVRVTGRPLRSCPCASVRQRAAFAELAVVASLPDQAGSADSTSNPSYTAGVAKQARRAELQQRIASAKGRLLAVQERLQAQAEAATGGHINGRDQQLPTSVMLHNVLAAAEISKLLRSKNVAAAAAQVAAQAAKVDQDAAAAAAAAAKETRRQARLLASLQLQLEEVAGRRGAPTQAAAPVMAAASTARSRCEPTMTLAEEASLLQEHGSNSKDEPANDAHFSTTEHSSTAPSGVQYDPWRDLMAGVHQGEPAASSKYEMLPSLLAALEAAAEAGDRSCLH